MIILTLLTAADWRSYGYTASEVTESLGEQTFEKQLDGVLSGKAIARRLMRLSLQMVYL